MKKAEIYSVSSVSGIGYAWKWRCQEDHTEGERAFMLYYECVTAARERGYEVEFVRPSRSIAPAHTKI